MLWLQPKNMKVLKRVKNYTLNSVKQQSVFPDEVLTT